MITYKLKPLVNLIISSSQSIFILNGIITENIIIANELLHSMKNNIWDKIGRVAMKDLGFADNWIHLIMSWVTTVHYSILLRGSLGQALTPTRGLRQGNSLSPYLFLFCTEGLSTLLVRVDR